MQALRRHGPALSVGGCGPRPHPRLQSPTQTHLAIYHHPQPRQLIASPRARPGTRRGRSPRPARGAAGRPAAGLMARPPVPARPGAPRPSPMLPPLSAPRLASPRRAPGGWGLAARFRWSSRSSGRVGGDRVAPPRPRPARPQVRGAGPGARAPGRSWPSPHRSWRLDLGCRPGIHRPARARDPA